MRRYKSHDTRTNNRDLHSVAASHSRQTPGSGKKADGFSIMLPCAGITPVRFKGSDLSPALQRGTPSEYRSNPQRHALRVAKGQRQVHIKLLLGALLSAPSFDTRRQAAWLRMRSRTKNPHGEPMRSIVSNHFSPFSA
jgi:hypothetical protein